jgi:F0F1-type ATP synthase delta subunit
VSDLAVARRYARALADAVAESKDQNLVLSELEEFSALFRADKMLRAYLLDVRAKVELRERVVNTVSEKGKSFVSTEKSSTGGTASSAPAFRRARP